MGLAGHGHRARAGDGLMGGRLLTVLRRLSRLVRRSEIDREVEEELRFHLEMGEAAARAAGASEDEARRAARLRLGNPLRLREESRDARGFPRTEALARDLSPRRPAAPAVPGLHDRGHADAGARHRSECRSVRPRGRGAPAAAALPRAREARVPLGDERRRAHVGGPGQPRGLPGSGLRVAGRVDLRRGGPQRRGPAGDRCSGRPSRPTSSPCSAWGRCWAGPSSPRKTGRAASVS